MLFSLSLKENYIYISSSKSLGSYTLQVSFSGRCAFCVHTPPFPSSVQSRSFHTFRLPLFLLSSHLSISLKFSSKWWTILLLLFSTILFLKHIYFWNYECNFFWHEYRWRYIERHCQYVWQERNTIALPGLLIHTILVSLYFLYWWHMSSTWNLWSSDFNLWLWLLPFPCNNLREVDFSLTKNGFLVFSYVLCL